VEPGSKVLRSLLYGDLIVFKLAWPVVRVVCLNKYRLRTLTLILRWVTLIAWARRLADAETL